MQSQQKRVKWSRGETAQALEERTDTGITQASVEIMENCIPDMYGNVSRRPGLKLISGVISNVFIYDEYMQIFPFYITETDYILVGIHFNSAVELIRIKDNGAVYHTTVTAAGDTYPKTGVELGMISGVYTYRPVSCAQQNNYMLISDGYNIWKLTVALSPSDLSFTPTLSMWMFTAGWYAPNGTTTYQVNNTTLPGLNISGNFTGYTYTNVDGTTTVYSITSTGLTGNSGETAIRQQIPVGSIVQLPNIGTYFRVEGYTQGAQNGFFTGYTFDSVVVGGPGNVPSTGRVCLALTTTPNLSHYYNGTLIETVAVAQGVTAVVKCTAYGSGYAKNAWHKNGAIITWSSWSEATAITQNVYMFGSLLTPVADESASDMTAKVETGYISLEPSQWSLQANYPHPKKLVFEDQRLWGAAWAYTVKDEYPITIGSQIARYTDFKNDYNQANEPITLDILTKYKERILHLVDYNGLKIMTESYEYAYENGAIVKQSANGSFEYCEPIVFDSLCLYLDSTGCQVKAMQYEFQNNIFNSSTINQLAPHDLVWYPWAMASYEDKTNSTGKYLFLVNRKDANARVAVCNFVPGNQAEIWNRWTFPTTQTGLQTYNSFIHSVVNLKDGTLFMVTMNDNSGGIIIPAIMDFDANTDCESPVYTANSVNYFAPIAQNAIQKATMKNTQVAVYADGEFQFLTTTDQYGAISDDISQLTNVTVGLPINARIVSHPIDVGGKTKSIKKRIAKTVLSVHDTKPGAITVNGKTGYMNPQNDKINFYGVTGMKDEIKYTLTNKNGAMFHLESLLMNIEYGTLIS